MREAGDDDLDELDQIIKDVDESLARDLAPVKLCDALAEPPPDTPWLLEGILPAGSIAIIAAEGGMGKSTLVAQMGLMLAAGCPDFFGFKIPKAAKVLYLQAEGARHIFVQRLKVAAFHVEGVAGKEDIPFFVQPRIDWIKDVGESTERMIGAVEADLTIMDTQGLFHAADENSNTEIKLHLIKPLQAIAVRTGSAFMLVHHLSKPGKDRPGGRHQIRGASAFVDDTDLSMMLEAPDGQKKPPRVLAFTKNRSGPHPEDVALEYVSDEARFRLRDTAAEEELRAERAAEERRKHLRDIADKMEAVIRLNPNLNGNQIDEFMGSGRKADMLAARALLLEQKRIFAEPGDKRALKYYAAAKS